MQTRTFAIEKNHRSIGTLFLNEWPGRGFSARFEDVGPHRPPAAVAIGTTAADAIHNLADQQFMLANHLEPEIRRVVLQLKAF